MPCSTPPRLPPLCVYAKEPSEMAVRYFCDNCGTETRIGELTALVISIPPQAETFDICPACTRRLRGELEQCGHTKRELEVLPASSPGRAIDRGRALLALPGVGPLARGLSYAAVFVALFVAVTLLTSLR